MKTGEACDRYLNLPSLIQPHNLNAEGLAPIAESLETGGSKIAHHLAAAACRIDLLHIASYTDDRQPNAAAMVDYAREQVAQCSAKLAAQNDSGNIFARLYQVSVADSYLGFYADPRMLPHGGWDMAGVQKGAYTAMQTTLLNPLLESTPRPPRCRADEKSIEEVLRGLVVTQTLHRLQETEPQAVFGVLPANIREQTSPQSNPLLESFKLKIVLPDHTFYPIRHPSLPPKPSESRHSQVAHITGHVVEGHEHYNARAVAKVMQKEVDGVRLRPFEKRLLIGATLRALEAMREVAPIGGSIYPPDDSRTRFAELTKAWLFGAFIEDLQAEYAA